MGLGGVAFALTVVSVGLVCIRGRGCARADSEALWPVHAADLGDPVCWEKSSCHSGRQKGCRASVSPADSPHRCCPEGRAGFLGPACDWTPSDCCADWRRLGSQGRTSGLSGACWREGKRCTEQFSQVQNRLLPAFRHWRALRPDAVHDSGRAFVWLCNSWKTGYMIAVLPVGHVRVGQEGDKV